MTAPDEAGDAMANERAGHVPVLLDAVMEYLAPAAGETIVDGTVGLGGHSRLIAEKIGSSGRLIAIDRDPGSLEAARERVVGCPVDWIHGNFGDLGMILRRLGLAPGKVEANKGVDAVLADFGVSSPQLDSPERGFSFRTEGPLDMRMNPSVGEPASKLLQRLSAEDMARIFWEFGEERYSRRVAAKIVESRQTQPITTTTELAELVRRVVPKERPRGRGRDTRPRIDPATRVFQALRIYVNDELAEIESLLGQLPSLVRPGGRVVLISFHSLEDRLVKNALRDRNLWEPLTKKPRMADEDETAVNPRSRSAKLRAGRRL